MLYFVRKAEVFNRFLWLSSIVFPLRFRYVSKKTKKLISRNSGDWNWQCKPAERKNFIVILVDLDTETGAFAPSRQQEIFVQCLSWGTQVFEPNHEVSMDLLLAITRDLSPRSAAKCEYYSRWSPCDETSEWRTRQARRTVQKSAEKLADNTEKETEWGCTAKQ